MESSQSSWKVEEASAAPVASSPHPCSPLRERLAYVQGVELA